jgi:hypothetical protein
MHSLVMAGRAQAITAALEALEQQQLIADIQLHHACYCMEA